MTLMNKERWQFLMSALGLAPSPDVFRALCDAYGEKHRFYHTGQHIEAMLRHLDTVQYLAQNRAELELAIWFHDAVYNPLSATNEADSAQWARDFLSRQSYDHNGIDRVDNMIMATLHSSSPETADEALIVDIDLAILGASPDVYAQFEQNVRQEYRWVPWFVYRRKRREVLASFLDQDNIYHLDTFRDRFEDRATSNLQNAIAML